VDDGVDALRFAGGLEILIVLCFVASLFALLCFASLRD